MGSSGGSSLFRTPQGEAVTLSICGTEALYAGAIEGHGDCMICGRENVPLRYGWVGTLCTVCERDWESEDPSGTVRGRLEYLGLTRKEMAQRTGLAQETIKHYETIWPSRRYFDQTLQEVRKGSEEKP